ncbi:MAG: SO_0444 family Cu/Zn efflux transporter [Nitrospinae bacterium]|nr:SO_0444 family Cu/Zn efflux transporter [Nitrospinota bacterium]
MDMAAQILAGAWDVLEESAIFLLGGFALAGLIKEFTPSGFVEKKLGGGGIGPVVRAALYGVPLPLCSCGVVPAAMGLRKMGATKGATSAFLISTPESGVDSIAVSYALLDPLMTVIRPIAAFFTAMAAGLLENMFGTKDIPGKTVMTVNDACPTDCADCATSSAQGGKAGFTSKIKSAIRYAFVEMIDDMALLMLAGVAAAGFITVIVPEGFFNSIPHSNYIAMPVMLLIGVPMYICATASTPLAAAMIIKGLSPGAALVFLLSGPATNIGSIMLIRDRMGTRSLAIYLSAIAVCSIAMGVALDALYGWSGINPVAVMGMGAAAVPGWIETTSAIVFLALTGKSMAKTLAKRGRG